MPEAEHVWVVDGAGVTRLAERLARAAWVALDTESNSMFVYRERLCLVQLHLPDGLVLVDPLALLEREGPQALEPLRGPLARSDRPLYLHGGEYDVGVFRRDLGTTLGGIWDTQQAAAMLGFARTGYGAMVEALLGVTLEKAYSQYNWATRPLDPGAERYALDDVRYLPALAQALQERVRDADLVEEVAIANAAVAEASWSGGFDPGGFWRVKGVRELRPAGLAVLASLWTWRDGIARAENLPPGRLVNNELLLALARNAPTNFQLLKRIGVRGAVLARHGESLIAAVRAATQDPPPLPARPRAREVGPEEEARETRLKDWRRSEAERRGVPLQVVLPAKALEHLKAHGAGDLASVPQLGAKRIARYGETLQRLAGDRGPYDA